MDHRTADQLAAGLALVRESPRDGGTVEMIVRRPGVDRREVLEEGRLTPAEGLVGDDWQARGSRSTADGSADPDRQLTLMNARFVDLITGGDRTAWPLAGDQLYVDLDLSIESLPPGTRLAVGTAVVEMTEPPHTGCAKFSARFGSPALRVANTPDGRSLRLRGAYARVVTPGTVRPGDEVRPA